MTALLFERDHVDEVDWTGASAIGGPRLWIDLEDPSEDERWWTCSISTTGGRSSAPRREAVTSRTTANYLHVRAIGSRRRERTLVLSVACLVAERWDRHGPTTLASRSSRAFASAPKAREISVGSTASSSSRTSSSGR